MIQPLPLDEAGIISTVLEGILYGFSLLMFMATMYTPIAGRKYGQINFPMVVVACLLWSSHIASDVKRLYTGLNVICTFQTALGDGVVIYRCYMVWRSIWIIILPIIMWLAVCTTGVGCVYTLSQPAADSGDIFVRRKGQWITSFYATTFACNLCATALLSYRLWTIDRNVHRSRVGRSLTMPVLEIVLDAGALYSVTLIAALSCFVSKSNGQYVNTIMGASHMSSTMHRTSVSRGEAPSRIRPMHVHIEQLTEVERDPSSDKANEAESHEMSRV
ncbi:hypothetical protein C8F04DRAFT_1213629 [Mycena alexandri]|uniref:Uncharacterized protein n=1 Tax=Mycena alexandri TaxID=1745969 RepID=A0AAD6WR96_9AGAR|nr:hypothetical protein C8F04DRAFT_1213629 [Mycena alexandri]